MLNRNLKYYRLRANLTKAELASLVNVSPMAITNYENGDRRPDMETIERLAKALGVRTADFLAVRNENLVFSHGEFRKDVRLSQGQQEYICEAVEEYFNRFYEAVELLGGDVLPEPPVLHQLELTKTPDTDAFALRKYMGIPARGPVGNLVELLENNGILIFMIDINNDHFNGMNGCVNGRPYIVINRNMSPERIRTAIVHETAYIAFQWADYIDGKCSEKLLSAITGSFLFPKADVVRELGIQRKTITTDMLLICRKYGISVSLLVERAYLCHIINRTVRDAYFRHASRNEESVFAINESPMQFEKLVYRAVNEGEITIQKGAELLQSPYDFVAEHCCPVET